MTRNNAFRRNPSKIVNGGKPAADAAIKHRDVLEKYQIARKQRAGRAIDDRQIAVAMRRAPSFEGEIPVPEIELDLVVDRQGRRHDFHVVEHGSHAAPKSREIERRARGQCPRQAAMANKNCGGGECGVAEHMIRMGMRVYDVFDWLVGQSTNCCKQTTAFAHAAAGVDDGDRIAADDKADIGNRAFVLGTHQRDGAEMDIDAGSDFFDRKWLDRLLRIGQRYCPANR